MTNDKRPEGLAIANVGKVPGDCTYDQAVENQEEHTAQAEQQAGGKGLEGDADVVHHVIAKHHPVFAGGPFGSTAQTAGVGVVHALHVGHLLGADDAVDKIGEQVHQQGYPHQAAKE